MLVKVQLRQTKVQESKAEHLPGISKEHRAVIERTSMEHPCFKIKESPKNEVGLSKSVAQSFETRKRVNLLLLLFT